eukprot:gene3424-13469_t
MALLGHMRDFCEEKEKCRHDILLKYFGDTLAVLPGGPGDCGGRCDNCVRRAAGISLSASDTEAEGSKKKAPKKPRAPRQGKQQAGFVKVSDMVAGRATAGRGAVASATAALLQARGEIRKKASKAGAASKTTGASGMGGFTTAGASASEGLASAGAPGGGRGGFSSSAGASGSGQPSRPNTFIPHSTLPAARGAGSGVGGNPLQQTAAGIAASARARLLQNAAVKQAERGRKDNHLERAFVKSSAALDSDYSD